MQSLLMTAALLSGLVAIASDWRGQRRALFYVAKPLTTVLILALAGVSLAAAPAYQAWVMAALGFCLVGDVALMRTGSRAFLVGLSSFLLGHVLFIAAFVVGLPLAPLQGSALALLAAAALVCMVVAYTGWLLPRMGRLKPWVLLYVSVLTVMVLVALLRADLAHSAAARWVLVGALLFAGSDAVLAYRKFVAQPWWGQPLTLLSYYLALGLIAWAH